MTPLTKWLLIIAGLLLLIWIAREDAAYRGCMSNWIAWLEKSPFNIHNGRQLEPGQTPRGFAREKCQ